MPDLTAKTILQGTVRGGRRQGGQRKRWEDNIREWTGLEFGKSQRAVENREKWRKLVAKSSVLPQRPSRLRNWWWWWWMSMLLWHGHIRALQAFFIHKFIPLHTYKASRSHAGELHRMSLWFAMEGCWCVHVCVCVCMHICVCVCVCVYVCVCVFVCMCVCAYVFAGLHVCMHAFVLLFMRRLLLGLPAGFPNDLSWGGGGDSCFYHWDFACENVSTLQWKKTQLTYLTI